MRIALVAPPWYPVPPHGYGGTELVVHLLSRALKRRGHEVVVFGAEGSEEGVLALAPRAWREQLGTAEAPLREYAYAARVYGHLNEMGDGKDTVDIIHEHSSMAGILAAHHSDLAPVVHTVHGPIWEPQCSALASIDEGVGLISISHSQRDSAPDLPWIGTVHNAVDIDALDIGTADEKEPYLLVLARVCVEKGQHDAIEVARRTGLKLVLAGKIDSSPVGLEYFQRQIEPFVDGDSVVYLPNVAGREKAHILARATAHLAPITWPEPFGLSTVEAMASGTPAISFNRGAASELIEEGTTGFVVDDVDSMCAAVKRVADIDPAACATNARERFSPDAMARGYLAMYRQLQAGQEVLAS